MSQTPKVPSKRATKLPRVTFWLLVIGGFIGLPTWVVVYNHWRIAIKADNYSKTVFVVKEVGISNSGGGSKKSGKHRWAEGTLNGKEERIGLAGFGAKSSSTEELQEEFPPGTELDVWHDQSAADVITQGRTLNVIPGSTNFGGAWLKAIIVTLLCDGIFLAGVVGYFECRRRGIRVFN